MWRGSITGATTTSRPARCAPFEQVTAAWESPDGQIAAVVHPIGGGEIRLHVHPRFRTPELEDEIFAHAEEQYAERPANGNHFMVVPVFAEMSSAGKS